MVTEHLVSEEQVKKALNINSFRNLSKDKIMEFVSLIPQMDKEVAIAIIDQFPEYTKFATQMVEQLNVLYDRGMASNDKSQLESIQAYRFILDELARELKEENVSPESRDKITEQMILVADKIAAKDTENKHHQVKMMKLFGGALLFLVEVGAAILGVKVKGREIPHLDDNNDNGDDLNDE